MSPQSNSANMDDNDNSETKITSFHDLPWELRQRILQLALTREGSIALQTPIWTDRKTYLDPLFEVCRSVRHEALEAFYKTNTFLYYVEVDDRARSDPSTYPTETENHERRMSPALPWMYPYLVKHVRHLYVRVHLSPEPHDVERSGLLSEALNTFARTLDFGRRLLHLNLFFTYGTRWSNTRVVTEAQREILQSLSAMEIPGMVKVTCFDTYLRQSINTLDLPQCMKARTRLP